MAAASDYPALKRDVYAVRMCHATVHGTFVWKDAPRTFLRRKTAVRAAQRWAAEHGGRFLGVLD